jgi:uncharacterized membrane protein SpoIIM required for sporulation
MREKRFVAARRPLWDRLDALVDRIDRRGIRALTHDEIDELAFGYRAATSDLAMARGRAYDPAVIGYLNRLTARAHAYVYLGTSRNGWAPVWDFLSAGFPREARRSWKPIGVCILITVISAMIAYTSVSADPVNAYALLGDGVPLVTKRLHDSNFGFDRTYAPAVSAQIMTHNIQIAFTAFAGGMTCGLLTLFIILENGLMVGGLGAVFAHAHFGLDFWATVAPHGVIELTAIQISGGAGLLLAMGIIAPGRVRRRDAIARNARRAGTLALGTAAMLVLAGLIEGFLTPQRFGVEVRIGIGTFTGIGLILYFIFAGRSQKRTRLDLDVGIEQGDAQFGGGHIDDADAARA